MKKITIHNEATIKAKGEHNNKLCKPVICIETGEVFTSAKDAAEHVGAHFSAMSAVCLGKTKTCKGKRYCYLNSALENLDAVMARLREASAMESDAKKWREQEAAKEAARKAEELRLEEERKARERHEAAVAKARAKVEKLTENCNKLESKLLEEEKALMDAEIELENLLGEEAQQVA